MEYILESELMDFMRNNAIKQLNVVQDISGKYHIVANLNWKKGDFLLVTSRKTTRQFANLDRLVMNIRENSNIPPPINLSIYPLDRKNQST